ncbi:MAG: NADH-quinone oxidoreductase subunit L [Nitrososphaerota archaeon]
MSVPSYALWAIFLVPYAGALLSLALWRLPRLRDGVALSASLGSALFSLWPLASLLSGGLTVYDSVIPARIPWIPSLGITAGVLSDPLTIILASLVAWISFAVMVYSLGYMRGDPGLTRYWFFMNFFIGNMELLVLSDNFLQLFFGWEGVGLCSYALIGHWYSDEEDKWVGTRGHVVWGEEQAYPPSHAGLKAFLMTRFGDVFFLAGLFLLYNFAHTFNYDELARSALGAGGWAEALRARGLLVPVALLIFGGAVGKSAQFPLHEWLPDAMAGPTTVSALIHAATMVNAGVVLVARAAPLFYAPFSASPEAVQGFFQAVAWIGGFTAFLAATQACVGFELKKILAYSTFSQIGYMILALGVAGLSSLPVGLSAGTYHLMSHAIFKATLFLAAGALIHACESKYVSDMGGLAGRMRVTLAAFLISAASLAGLPPFSGFWSKESVLLACWQAGQYGLFALAAASSALTAFYSFRLLGLIFYGGESERLRQLLGRGHEVKEAPPVLLLPYVALSLFTVLLGLLAPLVGLEARLEEASTAYLASLFPGLATGGLGGFALAPSMIGLGLSSLGAVVGWAAYISPRAGIRALGATGLARALYSFFEARWYINAFYYKAFMRAPLRLFNLAQERLELPLLAKLSDVGALAGVGLSSLANWFDANVVDRMGAALAAVSSSLSRVARRLQSGVVEQYLFVVAVGAVLVVLLLLFLLGRVAPA